MKTHYEIVVPPEDYLESIRRELGEDIPNSAAALFMDRIEKIRRGNKESIVRETLRLMQGVSLAVVSAICADLPPYSQPHFINDGRFIQYLDNLSKTMPMDSSAISFAAEFFFHIYTHKLCGRRVYCVAPGLAKALKDTELRGLVADDLRLPYESIYLQVPEAAGLRVWNNQTGWHKLVGMYITESLYYPGLDNKPFGSDFSEMTSERAWRFLLVGEDKGGEMEGVNVMDDAISFFRVVLTEGMDVGDILDKCQEQFMRGEIEKTFGEMVDYWQEPFRWAMNAVMYATNVDHGRKFMENKEARKLSERIRKMSRSKKRDQLRARLRTISRMDRIVIGEGVKCAVASNVRVRVQGHWRRVVHGAGRTLRKWKFIEPYWKGEGVFSESQHKLA